MDRRTYQVETSHDGERLDRFLAGRADDLSRARLQTLIHEENVTVDGQPSKASRRLRIGQVVAVNVPPPAPSELEPDDGVRFSILYQDPHLLVIDKPAGLVVHPAAGHARGTLVHGLLAAIPDLAGIGGETRPGIVHRLDKDTSGVMIVAKTAPAHESLALAFKNRTIDKWYVAICLGHPPDRKGEIDIPIGRHPVRRKEMAVNAPRSRPALTGYDILETFPSGASLLRLRIFTGRTHQIRVHLASLGCPVLGDSVYGRRRAESLLAVSIPRQMLHAHRVKFPHPVTQVVMEFEAPWPEDIRSVLAALGGDPSALEGTPR